MIRSLACLVAACLMVGCKTVADGPRPLTVNEVVGRLVEFDGQTVKLRGWVERCRGVECVLRGRDDAALSIASGPFDRELDANAPAEVVLLAKVDASCHSGKLICTDRTPDLRVIKIENIHPAAQRGHLRDQ